jgi:predicted nuclease of restriction endonuclease-like RecB superfamily
LEIDFVEGDVRYTIRGPFGVRRRFAHPNPGATDEEIALCMASATAQDFISGVAENSANPPQNLEEAQNWTESYCEGVIEGIKDVSEENNMPIPEEYEEPLRRAVEDDATVVVDADGVRVVQGETRQIS